MKHHLHGVGRPASRDQRLIILWYSKVLSPLSFQNNIHNPHTPVPIADPATVHEPVEISRMSPLPNYISPLPCCQCCSTTSSPKHQWEPWAPPRIQTSRSPFAKGTWARYPGSRLLSGTHAACCCCCCRPPCRGSYRSCEQLDGRAVCALYIEELFSMTVVMRER